MTEYLSLSFPEAMARAKATFVQVFFVNESAIRSAAHRGRTRGAVGDTPVVKDGGGRFDMNLISAASPRGDLRFSVIGETMDSARFIAFLKLLHRDAGGPILVVVDNAKHHHSKKTRCFIEAQGGKIELVYLPPHSPELNPNEQLWGHVRCEIGKRAILNKATLERVVLRVMRSLQTQMNLVRSFFQFRDTRYIHEDITCDAGNNTANRQAKCARTRPARFKLLARSILSLDFTAQRKNRTEKCRFAAISSSARRAEFGSHPRPCA